MYVTEDDHDHEKKNVESDSGNFQWSQKQVEIIRQGVRLKALPKVIRQNMKAQNALEEGRHPTATQLANKIAYEKSKLGATNDILTTQQLIRHIEEHTEVPVDPHKAFVVKGG